MYERRMQFGMSGFGGSGPGQLFTPWVKRLLIANAAVFFAMALGLLPAAFAYRWLGFDAAEVWWRPWSPLTYMFVHGGFGHLFMNMLALFFFGPPLEREWGSRFFLKFYLVAGLGGALFSAIFYPMIGPSLVVGASGAVFGLLLAFALNWPNAPIYLWFLIPVPAKWLVGALGLFTLYATFSAGGGGVAHWAHLGGLVTGFVYLRYGERIGRGLQKLIWKEKPSHVRVERGARPTVGRKAPKTRRGVEGDALDEVDRILDKIREHGMESLTPKERAFLDDMSRRYQKTNTQVH